MHCREFYDFLLRNFWEVINNEYITNWYSRKIVKIQYSNHADTNPTLPAGKKQELLITAVLFFEKFFILASEVKKITESES